MTMIVVLAHTDVVE